MKLDRGNNVVTTGQETLIIKYRSKKFNALTSINQSKYQLLDC
jgi:hypothetical protein